jgi:glycerate kinase
MRVLVAPQEFKGTLTATQAAEAMAEGVRRSLRDADIDAIPLSDGGPGLLEVLLASAAGRTMTTSVQDPLGRSIEALWALLDDGTAVIESAAAAGLTLLREHERNPAVTTSYGVGQLMLSVLDEGCRRLVVGVGGSATNDGGAGMASALGVRLLDSADQPLRPGGADLARLHRIDTSGLDGRIGGLEVIAATDVTNPLCGTNGASLVYAPQKGASPELAEELDAALRRYGEVIERDLSVPVLDVPGAGAAGGLGAGLIAFAGASIRPGFDVVVETIKLRERLSGVDLLITGEGRLDGQTLSGKTVFRLSQLAGDFEIPLLVVPGALASGWEAILPYVEGVEPVVGSAVTEAQALARPAELLSLTVERALKGWRRMRSVPI